MDFPVNRETKQADTIEEAVEYCRYWEEQKQDLPYDIDGIVLKVNALKHHRQLGFYLFITPLGNLSKIFCRTGSFSIERS